MVNPQSLLEQCLIVVLFGFLSIALFMHYTLYNMTGLLPASEANRRVDSFAYLDRRHPFRDNMNPLRDDSPEIFRKSPTDIVVYIIKCLKTTYNKVFKGDANAKLADRSASNQEEEREQMYFVFMGVLIICLYLTIIILYIRGQQVILDERQLSEDGNYDFNEDDDDSDDSDDNYNYEGYNNFDEFYDNNFLRDNLLCPDDDTDSDDNPGEINGANYDNDGDDDDDKTPVANQQPLSENRYQLFDDDSDYVFEGVLQPDGLIGSDVIKALNGHFGSVHGVGIRDSTIDSVFINDIPGMPPTWEDVNGSVFRPLHEFEDGERVLVIF